MQELVSLLEQYGLAFVFLNVLVEQAGLPLPAFPALVVAGALAARAEYSVAELVATAVVAAVIADFAWYRAGARLGRPVLRTLCRISLSPDSCVRRTESVYHRIGAPSLLVAKFIPGFATVATALSGLLRTRVATFLVYDALGSAIWAGSAVALGVAFRHAVTEVLDLLARLGRWGIPAIVGAFAAVVLVKSWQRHRFYRRLRMARVSVAELRALLDRGEAPTILDVRPASLQQAVGRIPGAVAVDSERLERDLPRLPARGEVIVYCSCPNEASAALVAKEIIRRGFSRVRPLEGGIDAWVAAGYALDR